MRESKKKKKKKDGYDDILGLSYDKDMGKYIHFVRYDLFNTNFTVFYIMT